MINGSEATRKYGKKQNFEIDSPLTIGDQGKYVTFSWPPPEAALSVFKVSPCLLHFFDRELIKINYIAINAES
jgi:hypothetical protein